MLLYCRQQAGSGVLGAPTLHWGCSLIPNIFALLRGRRKRVRRGLSEVPVQLLGLSSPRVLQSTTRLQGAGLGSQIVGEEGREGDMGRRADMRGSRRA